MKPNLASLTYRYLQSPKTFPEFCDELRLSSADRTALSNYLSPSPAPTADPRHDPLDGHCYEGCPCLSEQAQKREQLARLLDSMGSLCLLEARGLRAGDWEVALFELRSKLDEIECVQFEIFTESSQ
jgi:hypothetical protein